MGGGLRAWRWGGTKKGIAGDKGLGFIGFIGLIGLIGFVGLRV